MAGLPLLSRVRAVAASTHLARRRVSALRPPVRSMAAAAPSEGFQKIQIRREDTVSPPPLLLLLARRVQLENHFQTGACDENSNEIWIFFVIFDVYSQTFDAYVVGKENAPGMVVLQEWWGVDFEVKNHALHIAQMDSGFRALIPEYDIDPN